MMSFIGRAPNRAIILTVRSQIRNGGAPHRVPDFTRTASYPLLRNSKVSLIC